MNCLLGSGMKKVVSNRVSSGTLLANAITFLFLNSLKMLEPSCRQFFIFVCCFVASGMPINKGNWNSGMGISLVVLTNVHLVTDVAHVRGWNSCKYYLPCFPFYEQINKRTSSYTYIPHLRRILYIDQAENVRYHETAEHLL